MAVNPHYIADKSALARLRHSQVSDLLSPLILAGQIATCGIIELEVLYSARGHNDLLTTRADRALAFPLLPMIQGDFERAAEVMQLLAGRGLHRSVGIPDLLIAAVAERYGLTVLHYDADYEFVAAVTGQSMQWVAPRGSIP